MAWGKIDDKLWGSPKWLSTTPRGKALWVTALSWCMDQLTDGFVPNHVLPTLGGTRADARALVSAGLWDRATIDPSESNPRPVEGHSFHDWLDYQPSREQVMAERSAAAERQRRAREKARSRRESRRDTAVSHADSHASVTPGVTVPPTRPDPTRPINPVPPTAGRGAASTETGHDDGSTQTLLAEWIDNCNQPPPGKVKGQVAKELKTLLNEGIPYADVRAGLASWHHKGLHPATIPSVVHEVRNPARPSGRPTTDDKVRDGLELAERLRAQEAQTLLEIESAS